MYQKYKPKDLDDINLGNISMNNVNIIPNTIIYGEDGCGKYTLMNLWLKNIFGKEIYNIKKTVMEYKTTNKVLELNIFYSNYHYIVNPSLYGIYDKSFLQNFINDVSNTSNISKSIEGTKLYKIIVIQNAEQLTLNAQNALRSTIEKYINTCRFIFLSKSLNKIIEPIISRCMCIKIPKPNDDYVLDILAKTCDLNKIEYNDKFEINSEFKLNEIVKHSDGNIKKALNLLDLCIIENNTNNANFDEFNETISNINDLILKKDLFLIYDIRNLIYKLLVSCQKSNNIFKKLLIDLIRRIDSPIKRNKIINICTEMQYKSTLGNRPIIFLENFIVNTIKEIS